MYLKNKYMDKWMFLKSICPIFSSIPLPNVWNSHWEAKLRWESFLGTCHATLIHQHLGINLTHSSHVSCLDYIGHLKGWGERGKFRALGIIQSEWLIRVWGLDISGAVWMYQDSKWKEKLLIAEEKGAIKSDLYHNHVQATAELVLVFI